MKIHQISKIPIICHFASIGIGFKWFQNEVVSEISIAFQNGAE